MKYIALNKALKMLCNDQGLSVNAVKLRDIEFGNIDIERVEKALAKISKQDLETLCIGDEEDWKPILKRLGNDRDRVSKALDLMFNNLTPTEE